MVLKVTRIGLQELRGVGFLLAGMGFVIFGMTVPLTCMLPYMDFAFLHGYSYFMGLLLMYVGYLTTVTARDIAAKWDAIQSPDQLRRLIVIMVVPFALIMLGFGEMYKYGKEDGGLLNQVMGQIRRKEWGDLSPTDGQVTGLEWMYTISHLSFMAARLALAFGVILSTVIWINGAQNAADATAAAPNAGRRSEDAEVRGTTSTSRGEVTYHAQTERVRMLHSDPPAYNAKFIVHEDA
ncbi:uncharacterized protein LOC129591950 [Paramacrobiotus metropolitanus]|uniref:uncharacterized protein LOC129591950 n=1 Tax=Paramacrobiotus metropolitanus TaxID=2943436 RepID=UPI002445FB37|nr:uncharacterized protein LOC129591950 [Paramacrobiotus metropolitanus]XP_055343817.1 uncharacterized protein LOC129591950 [Paramacrobiotus metropolitanus]XP_055343819.1 uncharacterized protein LOC129591950 [Paramacrobiotus metropolitanus]XP_055343820.1 uncharacterized protein LOC129591950 [Paramacrobiotus metropolitanus]XP_055343821.1 uncharacterized protein LOC129591950 [Paramacrobiotus metropolitanus]XP_055343822.1 uncharacterized protein LOC129591950 [Paramacrobiotus metropolitanus]